MGWGLQPPHHLWRNLLLCTAAQLNPLRDVYRAALEWAARACNGVRIHLTAKEPRRWEDVGRPTVGRSIARARVIEIEELPVQASEHIDIVSVGACVGSGDRGDPGVGILRAEAVHGEVQR